MRILVPACTLVMAVSLSPSLVSAKSDCHQSMKDLLDGTLEVVGEVESQRSEASPSETCTLADRQDQLRVVVSL